MTEGSPDVADHSPNDARPTARADLRGALQGISTVAAPVSIVAALALYIGTVRQEALSGYFGLNVSVLGFTPQDYMLRSIDALVPFLVGLCGVLLLLVIAWALAAAGLQRHLHIRPFVAFAAIALGAILVTVGGWRLASLAKLPDNYLYLAGPLALGLGTALLVAGARLSVDHGLLKLRQLSATFWTIGAAASVVLLLVALFWAANDYARIQGDKRAEEIAGALGALPGVILHSERQLHVSSPGVQEAVLTSVAGEHLYRYDGLHLLVRSDGKYFLIPTSWSRGGADAVLVLPDDEQVQLEFAPGGRS
jgi:hypothetical protein